MVLHLASSEGPESIDLIDAILLQNSFEPSTRIARLPKSRSVDLGICGSIQT
jgi:hypothetical protein